MIEFSRKIVSASILLFIKHVCINRLIDYSLPSFIDESVLSSIFGLLSFLMASHQARHLPQYTSNYNGIWNGVHNTRESLWSTCGFFQSSPSCQYLSSLVNFPFGPICISVE